MTLPPTYEKLLGTGYTPPSHILHDTVEFHTNRMKRGNLDQKHVLLIQRFLDCLQKGVFQKDQCGCWADVSSEEGPRVRKTLQDFWSETPRKNVEYFHIYLGLKPLARG